MTLRVCQSTMEKARALRRSLLPLHLAAGVSPLVLPYSSSLPSPPGCPGGRCFVGVPDRIPVRFFFSWGCIVPAAELLSRSIDHLKLEDLRLDSPSSLSVPFVAGPTSTIGQKKHTTQNKTREKTHLPEETIHKRTYFHKHTHTRNIQEHAECTALVLC